MGASWAILGGLGGILGALGSQKSFWTQQGPARGQTYVPKGDQDGAQMGAKVCQNRRQNGPKSKTKTKTKTDTFQDRLKAILGSSWADLGTHLGSKKCVLPCVFHCFLNMYFFDKVRCQEATWAELGPTWAPKRVQHGAQKRAKTEQKKRRKVK